MIALALALLLLTVAPGLAHTLAADRRFARYLRARQRYARYLATEAQRVVNLNLEWKGPATL